MANHDIKRVLYLLQSALRPWSWKCGCCTLHVYCVVALEEAASYLERVFTTKGLLKWIYANYEFSAHHENDFLSKLIFRFERLWRNLWTAANCIMIFYTTLKKKGSWTSPIRHILYSFHACRRDWICFGTDGTTTLWELRPTWLRTPELGRRDYLVERPVNADVDANMYFNESLLMFKLLNFKISKVFVLLNHTFYSIFRA